MKPSFQRGSAHLAAAQAVQLVERLTGKAIHGVFYHQTERQGYDTDGSFTWLTVLSRDSPGCTVGGEDDRKGNPRSLLPSDRKTKI